MHLMLFVNILPIRTILGMTKILYSHEFMMKKSSMLITYCQNACNYKFTISKRDRSYGAQKSIYFKFTPLIISFSQKKKNKKLSVMDHVKLSGSLSAHVSVAFKIIIKLDYLER